MARAPEMHKRRFSYADEGCRHRWCFCTVDVPREWTTDDWSEVTCKRCLRYKPAPRAEE